ncbi:winged helix-turn-helix transcriptional regulator [Cryptosporangium phraense]|uniref:Helix-turn-helix transcriptional regulator n=1 Tax=Cryptosporangium phraense TaxID=2593070 RepID=A0A545AKU9_9ACTN|nr:winged helix-turn-helix transcriptional regulator [Cryptosporangium phraense]TQS41938.1 helix-turn-helix transcriptional regulator [Cryptosporangium phraense]
MSDEQPTELEPGGTNAVGKMLGLLGDEWTLLLIQQALQGVTRYGQFKAALPISNAVLTARLNLLTEQGLLERNVYQSNPLRAEYLTTPRSRSLWPFMIAIWEWERRWVPAHELPQMVHTVCEREFHPVLSCSSCDKPAAAREIGVEWGPSGSWERSVPAASTRRRWDSEQVSGAAGMFPDTMTILGNRWASALMGAAFRGVTRFTDFEKALGAPPTLVADRIRAFVAIDVLVAMQNDKRPDWVEYRLTEKGRAFFPVVATALAWSQHWFRSPEGPALIETHQQCGAPFEPQFRCDQCNVVVHRRDIRIVPL